MTVSIVSALDSFVGEISGEKLDIRKGDLFEADHPAVQRWPGMFEPVRFRFPVQGRVEQATAAPGERRKR